jgi:hypothetical protein
MGRASTYNEGEQAFKQTECSANLTPIGRFLGGRPIEIAKEFVCAIDQVNFHFYPSF